MPQVIYKIFLYSDEIALHIITANEKILKETWGVKHIEHDRVNQWINIVSSCCVIANFKEVLSAIFYNNKYSRAGKVAEKPVDYK